MKPAASQIMLCRESGSGGCWRLNEKGMQFCFHFIHYTVAKLIVGDNSLLSPDTCKFIPHLEAEGSTEPASSNNCHLDLTWVFSVSYHLPPRSLNEADKNNAKFSKSPMEMPASNLLFWKHSLVSPWRILWNFSFLGKCLHLEVFQFRIQFCPTNLKNYYGNQVLSEL